MREMRKKPLTSNWLLQSSDATHSAKLSMPHQRNESFSHEGM